MNINSGCTEGQIVPRQPLFHFAHFQLSLNPAGDYPHELKKAVAYATASVDVSDKIRTRDLLVRSQTLYPAELHLHSNSIL